MDSASHDNDEIYGPVLPPNIAKSDAYDNDNECSDDKVYGPCLPASFKAQKPSIIGPILPENFKVPHDSKDDIESKLNHDDDEDIIGPLPADQIDKKHITNFPRKIGREETGPKREKWMLEPGKAFAKALQTKSVTRFSQKTSKEKPLTEEDKLELQAQKEKEEKMKEFLNKYEKSNKRDTSLLEMHRKEMKNNKKLKTTSTTDLSARKEFDRERDLFAPRMDSKKKKTLIKEASSTFGTKFSSGKFEKFL